MDAKEETKLFMEKMQEIIEFVSGSRSIYIAIDLSGHDNIFERKAKEYYEAVKKLAGYPPDIFFIILKNGNPKLFEMYENTKKIKNEELKENRRRGLVRF